MGESFSDIFLVNKPIIGMIHMEGHSSGDKLDRALEELEIYEEYGVDGAIIEDYHGTEDDVKSALELSSRMGLKIIKGIKLTQNPYFSFKIADDFGLKFVKFNSVQVANLDLTMYDSMRESYPQIKVLGGFGFEGERSIKYSLKHDLEDSQSRCEAIVAKTPRSDYQITLDRLTNCKAALPNSTIMTCEGVNKENVRDRLEIADGAIIGRYFKHDSKTRFKVERQKVKDLMYIVNEMRQELVA